MAFAEEPKKLLKPPETPDAMDVDITLDDLEVALRVDYGELSIIAFSIEYMELINLF